jgi:hypothetical protein
MMCPNVHRRTGTNIACTDDQPPANDPRFRLKHFFLCRDNDVRHEFVPMPPVLSVNRVAADLDGLNRFARELRGFPWLRP